MKLRTLLLALFLASLTGCTLMAPPAPQNISQVERYASQQRYRDALTLLDQLERKHPQDRTLKHRRTEILNAARVHAQEVKTQASQLADRGHWHAAFALYDRAQQNLPQSDTLRLGRSALEARRDQRVKALERGITLARGEWLLHALELQQTLVETNDSSFRTRHTLADLKDEAHDTASHLLDYGAEALKRGQLQEAQRCVTLASKLEDTPASRKLLSRIETRKKVKAAEERRRAEAAAQARWHKERAGLLTAYRQAFARHDYLKSRKLMAQLRSLAAGDKEIAELNRQLEAAIRTRVKHYIDHGSALYAKGHYEQALATWRKAQVLDPENGTVAAHIERGRRVVETLRELQRQQQHKGP